MDALLKNYRIDENKFCFLCTKRYDGHNNKPYCLIPCGHTYCHYCVKTRVQSNKCVKCQENFNQFIPDYEMIDMVKRANFMTLDHEDALNGEKSDFRAEYKYLILEGTIEQQLLGTQNIRKILSKEKIIKKHIDQVIDAGLVPALIENLESKNYELQFESAWALTNIASGTTEQCKYLIDNGIVPPLIRLINKKNLKENVEEQVVWLLGNLAGDNALCRDLLLDNGILKPLLEIITTPNKKNAIKSNTAFCLSNLCRGKPRVSFSKIEEAIPIFSQLLSSEKNFEVLTDISWGVSYISDGSNEDIQKIIDMFDLKVLTDLLNKDKYPNQIVKPVVRIIGNICTGDDQQTDKMLNCNILPIFYKMLTNETTADEKMRKEIFWTLSNICAGNKEQIQKVIDEKFMPKIIKACMNDVPLVIKKEACWALANFISGSSNEQVKYLINECDYITALHSLLNESDKKLKELALESLNDLLTCGDDTLLKQIKSLLEDAKIKEIVECLVNEEKKSLADLAEKFLELT